MALPTGTVTFLFTDIEGSTRLVQRLGDRRSAQVLADHRRLLQDAVHEADGRLYQDQGESFLFVFERARDALQGAVAAQRALAAAAWPDGIAVRVRMGVHTGEPLGSIERYVGVDVHRVARICQAGHGGQILVSEATRLLVEADLPDGIALRDLGARRLKDLRRPERLHQLVYPGGQIDFPPLRSLDALPNNLPLELTSFIGRERELAEVKRLLASARILTLVGAGGLGKTRLALHAAAEIADGLPDGVWLVELAALSDPALVPQAVASALHVREQPGQALAVTLAEDLRPRHLLLILDNCEHLLDACARLAQTLLSTCPDLRILATSRQRLGIAAEIVWSVPPLAAPDPSRLGPREQVTAFEAVRLFVDRATATRPDFAVTAPDLPILAQVCHRLDGIPLAIELAAARTRVLSIRQIAERLEDRFGLLVAGSRAAPPRHQTLRAVMDWSHALLSEPEQIVLRRLAAFAGGCTLEAAEAVCAGGAVSREAVLDLITQLVDKSLVNARTQQASARFEMLETVREYARMRLEEAGEVQAARDRHLEWFVRFAEQADGAAHESDAWLDAIEIEHDNLRAALDHANGAGTGAAALRLAGALRRFWLIRGNWTEGRRYLEAALAATDAGGAPRVKALSGAAILAQSQGDYARAEVLSRERLAIHRAQQDQRGMADALNSLGIAMLERGDYRAAHDLLEESLGCARAVGDPRAEASALVNLANVAEHEGDYPRAGRLCEESLALFRAIGDRRGSAFAVNLLGLVALDLGEYAAARARFEEGLAIRRELGEKRGIAGSLLQLGTVARKQGADELARSRYEEALAIYRMLGDRRGIAAALLTLGLVAWRQGRAAEATKLLAQSLAIRGAQGNRTRIAECLEALAMVADAAERAARLLGAAAALRDAAGTPLPLDERPDHDRMIGALRQALGQVAFAAAWEAGRAMPVDDAVAYARPA